MATAELRLDSPGSIHERLLALAVEIGSLGEDWQAATNDEARLKGEYELAMAKARLRFQGDEALLAAERDAKALQAVQAEGSLYTRYIGAKGATEGAKARFRALDRASSNLQSILAAHRADSFRPAPHQGEEDPDLRWGKEPPY